MLQTLRDMATIDERIIEEKFKMVYALFENKFENSEELLKEIISHQKVTNSRVTKLEAARLLFDKDITAVSKTLEKLNDTLQVIEERTSTIELKQISNAEEHEDINEKLDDIEHAISDARKRGIRFWLWFSENKIRILIILIIIYVVALPALQDVFLQLFFKLIGKI